MRKLLFSYASLGKGTHNRNCLLFLDESLHRCNAFQALECVKAHNKTRGYSFKFVSPTIEKVCKPAL